MILGIDPGTLNCGWGIIKKSGKSWRRHSSGVIKMKSEQSLVDRIDQVLVTLRSINYASAPDAFAIESPIVLKNMQSAIKLARLNGAVLMLLTSWGECGDYAPTEVKKYATGKGNADKALVASMVRAQLGIDPALKLATDETDALAVALTHAARWKR